MNPISFLDAPGWQFWIEEVSANVYSVKTVHLVGPTIETTGLDAEKLLEECHFRAKEMAEQMATRRAPFPTKDASS